MSTQQAFIADIQDLQTQQVYADWLEENNPDKLSPSELAAFTQRLRQNRLTQGDARAMVCAFPDEDSPRLLYADCLESTVGGCEPTPSEKARAEFIRLDIQLSQMGSNDPARRELSVTAGELFDRYANSWEGELANFRASGSYYAAGRSNWERGFCNRIRLRGADADEQLARLCFMSPITRIVPTEDSLDALVTCPRFAQIKALETSETTLNEKCLFLLSDRQLRKIAESPYCSNLRALRADMNITLETIEKLAKSPLKRLETLDLSNSNVADAHAKVLAAPDCLPTLRVLKLNNTNIGDAGAIALAARSPALEVLELARTKIFEKGALAFARADASMGCAKLRLPYEIGETPAVRPLEEKYGGKNVAFGSSRVL